MGELDVKREILKLMGVPNEKAKISSSFRMLAHFKLTNLVFHKSILLFLINE